jgi:hypothetical protein
MTAELRLIVINCLTEDLLWANPEKIMRYSNGSTVERQASRRGSELRKQRLICESEIAELTLARHRRKRIVEYVIDFMSIRTDGEDCSIETRPTVLCLQEVDERLSHELRSAVRHPSQATSEKEYNDNKKGKNTHTNNDYGGVFTIVANCDKIKERGYNTTTTGNKYDGSSRLETTIRINGVDIKIQNVHRKFGDYTWFDNWLTSNDDIWAGDFNTSEARHTSEYQTRSKYGNFNMQSSDIVITTNSDINLVKLEAIEDINLKHEKPLVNKLTDIANVAFTDHDGVDTILDISNLVGSPPASLPPARAPAARIPEARLYDKLQWLTLTLQRPLSDYSQ